jgi:hypothetical protein
MTPALQLKGLSDANKTKKSQPEAKNFLPLAMNLPHSLANSIAKVRTARNRVLR